MQQFHAYTSTNYLWPDFALTFPEEYIHSDEQHIFSQYKEGHWSKWDSWKKNAKEPPVQVL